jgi:hypothetical protein
MSGRADNFAMLLQTSTDFAVAQTSVCNIVREQAQTEVYTTRLFHWRRSWPPFRFDKYL